MVIDDVCWLYLVMGETLAPTLSISEFLLVKRMMAG